MYNKVLLKSIFKRLGFMAAGSVFLFASHSWAYDGTINVTGNIIDGSCDISTDSQNINVDLGSVPVDTFTKVGDKSNPSPFTITLKNCSSAINGADVMFIGTPDAHNSTLLGLTQEPGVAQNVGIRILRTDYADFGMNEIVYLNKLLNSGVNFDDDEEEKSLTYALRYEESASGVTVGTGNAVMYFDIYYR